MVSYISIVNLASAIAILVCGLLQWTRGEVFTAISDCEPLLDTHRLVIDHMDDFVQREEKKLIVLKKQLNTYKTEHEKMMEDVANYLGNPINAFTLIKRLTKDLKDIDQIVKQDYEQYMSFNRQNASFPSDEDLVGAAHALTRLQATYKLEVKELAEGLLNGVAYSSSMSADDCFELGRALFGDGEYRNCIAWMKEALRKYQEGGDKNFVHSFTEGDVYDYISWSYYTLDDLQNALDWIRKLLAVDPNHSRAGFNEVLFLEKLTEKNTTQQQPVTEEQPITTEENKKAVYEALCRGDYDIPHEISKKLYCFYLTENHPFLRLAPIKAEKAYANPDAYVFYDVISDDEIAHVQDMARPRFKRAVVFDPTSGGQIPATYRISKTGWLEDYESAVVARISRRIADFTGLTMDTAEALQIANYGIGGHYEPHYDFSLKGDDDFKNSRFPTNRIATVLFYMSEVAEGGATVFTELGLTVFPIKNAALFWMNLHPSGEGDLYTRHAACPVLRGSKWVANKWLHQGGQEMVKKAQCTLEFQPEEMNRVIPKPIPKARRK